MANRVRKVAIAAGVALGLFAVATPTMAQGPRGQGGGTPQGAAAGQSTPAGRSMSVGDAEAQLHEAEQQPGPPARRLTRPLIMLGWAYWRAGREQDAIASLRRAVALMDALPQPHRPVLGRMLSDLGYFLNQNGRPS